MRLHRAGATGAMLLSAAMLAAACGSGGGSKSSSTTAAPAASTASLASKFVFGGPPECKTRQTCLLGLQNVYGLQFKDFKSLGGPLTKTALASGQIQVARLFTTDKDIQNKTFVALQDDKNFQLVGDIVPVIRTAKATDEVKSLLNSASAALTQDDLVAMDTEIEQNHADPGDQATAFIQKKGLKKASTPGAKESIIVGSANFPESVLLADIYGGVLKDAGYSVSYKVNLGAREITEPALEGGQLDLMPEYVGNYLNFIDPTVTGGLSLDQTVQKLNATVVAKGLTLLTPSAATDADAIAVTKATADTYHLTKISDLAKAG